MSLTDSKDLILHHCNTGLSTAEPVTVVAVEESGSLEPAEGQSNCEPGAAQYIPEELGNWTITITTTFSDSSTCQTTALVHVSAD